MKTIEQLHDIAAFFLMHKRTNCQFMHIYDYYQKGTTYVFRAYFKCKRTIVIRKVILDTDGEFVKYD